MHDAAQAALQQQLARLLEEVGAPGAPVSVTSTPRRFVLFLPNVPVRESDREEEIKGPPRRAAYDAKGEPTQALHGFLRKNNATTADILEATTCGFDAMSPAGRLTPCCSSGFRESSRDCAGPGRCAGATASVPTFAPSTPCCRCSRGGICRWKSSASPQEPRRRDIARSRRGGSK